MDIEYPVKLAVTLKPIINKTAPEVLISVPGHAVVETLWRPKEIEFDFSASQAAWLEIKFLNKNYNEYTSSHDMAVIVDRVEFFGIADPRFVWAGVYCPDYPEPWYSQQSPLPAPALTNHNYLGWNGVWRLDFDVPVFGWIHRTMGMGWVYS